MILKKIENYLSSQWNLMVDIKLKLETKLNTQIKNTNFGNMITKNKNTN
jgi:hypothetical protein